MFTFKQYRAKAVEYGDLAKSSIGSKQKRDFQKLERRFAGLADNEQLLADNYQGTVRGGESDRLGGIALADEEEHVLRCLGAALIMQWNTLPTKLRRELFDNAGSMGELLETPALRGQIARFLHKHKNDEDTASAIRTETTAAIRTEPAAAIRTATAHDDTGLHAASIARWDDEGGASAMTEQRRTPKSRKYRRRVRVIHAAEEDC